MSFLGGKPYRTQECLLPSKQARAAYLTGRKFHVAEATDWSAVARRDAESKARHASATPSPPRRFGGRPSP